MIDETIPGTKRRLDGRRRILRETGAPAMGRFGGDWDEAGGNGGGERKNATGGPRKSLIRLDSAKEIQAYSLGWIWPGLGWIWSIWLDLAKFGFGLDFPRMVIGADFIREDGLASDDHFGSAGCCVCKYSWTFFGASARFTAAAMAGSGLRIGGTA